MFYRLKTQTRKRYFSARCKGVFDTPPVGSVSGGPVILTQLIEEDLCMYLIAVKSLYHRLGEGRIAVVLDKSWSRRNLDLLEQHVRLWKTFYTRDRRSEKCPVGGCWERLLTIADLVENDYLIQLDADTVSLGRVVEVEQCITSGTSFMIGTWKGQHIEPADVSAQRVLGNESRHVQILAEQNLMNLGGVADIRYARGQASFAGFAKGSFSVARLEALSDEMRGLVGKDKWSQWGSESFASNLCVANSQASIVLPWPKYASYYPSRNADFTSSAFLHFEGTYRFKNGAYLGFGQRIIGQLKDQGT